MRKFVAAELSQQENYKLLSGAIIPRPIAWITTQNADGLVNAAPFSFFNVVSSQPPLLAVTFMSSKDSYRNLMATKEAVVQLVSGGNVEAMNQTAASLDASISEPEEFGIELVASDGVAVPGIQNSLARFECRLYRHVPLENDVHLMLLEVQNYVFDDQVVDPENLHVDAAALDPIARLAGNEYAQLGRRFEIVRPK